MPTSGPTRTPSKKLVKKFNYTETIKLNNATSTYSFYSAYNQPDITRATGSLAQFSAYELWRIKKIRVSIQMATSLSGTSALNSAITSTIWTAADLGANESISGETIMQYQNAKRNTPSLNKWTNIVDTRVNVNSKLNSTGSNNFILPTSTWLNTSYYDSSDYSGYQLFIQNFGLQPNSVENQPSYTLQTEIFVEFLQPAFQNNASNFTVEAFNMKMTVQPNASDPTDTRTYIFKSYSVSPNTTTLEREFLIHLKREDGLSGTLTFNGLALRNAIITGTSAPYFSGRPIVYDGPMPPLEIPDVDFEIINN
eukprot:549467_1